MLDPNHKLDVRSRLDQHTEDEFAKLHRMNEKYDITYNHSGDNSNKIFLINLVENCSLFNSKTPAQLKKLMTMLQKVYGK